MFRLRKIKVTFRIGQYKPSHFPRDSPKDKKRIFIDAFKRIDKHTFDESENELYNWKLNLNMKMMRMRMGMIMINSKYN